MKQRNIARYTYLMRTFRNGASLVQNVRRGGLLADGPPAAEAALWNGHRIRHPRHRSGLTGSILEIWHANLYRLGVFYRPAPGDVVLDIGAHVGLFALSVAQRAPGCRVVAVEPSGENFACLADNVRHLPHVQARRRAIGPQAGCVRTRVQTNRSIDTRVEEADPHDQDAVGVVTLPELVEEAGRVALLKMDVEGAERAVFEAVDRSTLERVERIALEYHDNYEPGTLELLRRRLDRSHHVSVWPDGSTGHGRLFAEHRRASSQV